MIQKRFKRYNSDREEVIDAVLIEYNNTRDVPISKEALETIIVKYESLIAAYLSGDLVYDYRFIIPKTCTLLNTSRRKKKKSINKLEVISKYSYQSFMAQTLTEIFVGLLK